MQADDAFRTLGHRGDLVDVQARGVGGQDRAGFADGVELGEDVLLDVHAFEHRLDHQIDIGERVFHRQRAGDQRAAFLDLGRRDAAARGGALIVLADGGQAAVQRLLILLDDHHGDAGVGEVHRDAAAHGAGADDADLLDRDQGGVFRNVRDLLGGALGEERIALGRRLRAAHQFVEQLALDRQAFVEGQVNGRFDGLDVVFRSQEAAELAGVGLAEVGEDLGLAAGGLDLFVLVADLAQRLTFGDHLLGEGDGAFLQLAFFEQFVGQAAGQGLLGADVTTRGHHFQGALRADHARQALGAAGARQQTEVHFRQAELRRRNSHAVVGAQRHFETAAQHRTVDRGDHRLGRVFHHVLNVGQAGTSHRAAELGDVGAGDEGAAFADQHDGLGGVIGDRGLEAFEQAFADLGRQGVHRR